MHKDPYFIINRLLKEQSINFQYNYNISIHTPFDYPVISKIIIYPKTIEQTIYAAKIVKEYTDGKIYFFGNFSNSIIHEKSKILNGPVIITKSLRKFDIFEKEKFCEIESGYPLPKFSNILSNKNFEGFSGLLGIPGSIGGAICMNAGSYGHEISDKLISVNYLDQNLKIKTIEKKNINFDWRYSIFQDKLNQSLILSAKFRLDVGNNKKIQEHKFNSKKHRSITQEKAGNNYGSVFATKWIYNESKYKSYKYEIFKKFLNLIYIFALKLKLEFARSFLTKILINFNKKYFNISDSGNIKISNKSLNCFLIENKDTKPSEYINFISSFKKKFNPKCKVEIRIYE